MTIKKRFKGVIRKSIPPALLQRIRLWRVQWHVRRRVAGKLALPPRPHGLPGPLAVSLTSFPPRFPTLHLTLRNLLRQSIRADEILLWIAHDDLALLPDKVRAMASEGITIRGCPDIRSYKKLIYMVEERPDWHVVTSDDDTFYDPLWLEALVEGATSSSGPVVTCHRAHRIKLDSGGRVAPYGSWDMDVQDDAAREPSCDLLPTGVGGVLYPPGCFDPRVTDASLFARLSPTADDLWFYWMARLAGSRHKKVGGEFETIDWPLSQHGRLADDNISGGNDRQIALLEEAFGNPMNWTGVGK